MNLYILLLSLLGFLTSLILIIKNNKTPDTCPLFFNVPACFIVAMCYAFVMLSVSMSVWLGNLLFWGGSAIGLILAIWFSFQQFFNKQVSCPRFVNIPLCYASFLTFMVLIIMWLFR